MPEAEQPAAEQRDEEQDEFTVGPPQPITDSRNLPGVTPEDEAGFVHGADLGDQHPDNLVGDDDDAPPVLTVDVDEEDLPSEDELAALVADVDTDDVDQVGFDDSDLHGLADLGSAPVGGGA